MAPPPRPTDQATMAHRRREHPRRPLAAAAALLLAVVLVACGGGTSGDGAEGAGGGGASGAPADGTSAGSTAETEAGPPDAGGPEAEVERALFELTNRARAERGLAELRWSDELAGLADDWSQHLVELGRLQHQDTREMLEASEGYVAVGENLFRATAPVAASTIHVGWMRSDGHRRNLLQPGFTDLGIGVVCAEDGSVWATQRFGRSDDAGFAELSEQTPPEEPIVAQQGEGPACPGGPVEGELQLDEG